MDNNNKLIFFLLFFLSFEAFAGFDKTEPWAFEGSTKTATGRSVSTRHPVTVTTSDFKRLMGMPVSSTFAHAVPNPASGSITRPLNLPKSSIGLPVKRLALAGARLGLYGAAFEAAVLAGQYFFEEYLEGEFKPSSYVEGDYKDVYALSDPIYDGSGWVNYVQSASLDPDLIDGYINNCTNNNPNYNPEKILCYFTQDPEDSDIEVVGFDSTPTSSSEKDYLSYEDFYDQFIDPMSDQEFDDFINDPSVLPLIQDTPEYKINNEDSNSDWDRSTDYYNDGNPNPSTRPFTIDQYDPNLDTLVVPDYDDVPLTTIGTESDGSFETTIETTTSSTFDLVNFTETQTTLISTTTINIDTGTVVDSHTQTKTRTIPRPDLNPDVNPDFDPNANPDPTTPFDPDGTTTTSGKNPNAPLKVEVVNFPPSLTDPESVPPVNPCQGNETKLGCLEVGDNLPEPPIVVEYEVPFEVNPFALSGVAECPPPIYLTLLIDGHTYEFSYQALCDFATMLNPVIVSLGFLLSFMIVANTIRHDN